MKEKVQHFWQCAWLYDIILTVIRISILKTEEKFFCVSVLPVINSEGLLRMESDCQLGKHVILRQDFCMPKSTVCITFRPFYFNWWNTDICYDATKEKGVNSFYSVLISNAEVQNELNWMFIQCGPLVRVRYLSNTRNSNGYGKCSKSINIPKTNFSFIEKGCKT